MSVAGQSEAELYDDDEEEYEDALDPIEGVPGWGVSITWKGFGWWRAWEHEGTKLDYVFLLQVGMRPGKQLDRQ